MGGSAAFHLREMPASEGGAPRLCPSPASAQSCRARARRPRIGWVPFICPRWIDLNLFAAPWTSRIMSKPMRSSRTVRAGDTFWRFTVGSPAGVQSASSSSTADPPSASPTREDEDHVREESSAADPDEPTCLTEEEEPEEAEKELAGEALAADVFSKPVWQGLGQITNLFVHLLDTHQRDCTRELRKQVQQYQLLEANRVAASKDNSIVEQMLREIVLEDPTLTTDNAQPQERMEQSDVPGACTT